MGPQPTPKRIAAWIAVKLPRLLRSYDVSEAYLFGSWARGDADEHSDIDVIIVAGVRRPFVDRFREFPLLWQTAPAGIDLLVYTPDEFRAHRRTNRFLRNVLRSARRLV